MFWLKSKGKSSSANDREVLNCLALFLLAFLAYANTLVGSFVYDDNYQVVENPYAHSFRYLPKIFSTSVWSFQAAQGPTNYFRPMMTFGYLLFYQIAGPVPFSFHLANIVLHALIALLVFFMLRRLSGQRIRNANSDVRELRAGVAFQGTGNYPARSCHSIRAFFPERPGIDINPAEVFAICSPLGDCSSVSGRARNLAGR